MKKSVVVLLVLFCLIGVVVAGSGTLEDPYVSSDFPQYDYAQISFPSSPSAYLAHGATFQFSHGGEAGDVSEGYGGVAPRVESRTIPLEGETTYGKRDFSDFDAFFVDEGNLFGVSYDESTGDYSAQAIDCAGACYPNVNPVENSGSFNILGDKVTLDKNHPNYDEHVEKLKEMGVGEPAETCSEPPPALEHEDGSEVDTTTDSSSSSESSSTESETPTMGLTDDQLKNPITNPDTGEPSLNVKVEAGEGEDKGKKEAEAFAKQANCLDDAQMKTLAMGFSDELSNNPNNVNLLDDFWNAEELKPETKQKFMKEFLSHFDGLSFSGDGNLKGKWDKSGDSVDFTPEGFSGSIGLPQIKKYNLDKKPREYTSVNTGNKKTESFQELTGVSLENGVLKYMYDNGKGKTVSIAQGSETTFDASKNELTLKDGRKAEVWGKGAITVGKDGSVDFGFDHDGENLRTGRVKIGDNFYGSSMWPIQEPVNFPEGFQKPSQKGTYTYHKEGNRLFSVDSDGVVREFQSSKLLPTTDKDVLKMVGGFTSGEAGLYFASTDTSGTAINWDGKPTDGNTFAYDSSEKNLFIRSQGDSWFTQRQNLNDVKLEGGALLQNGNALAIEDPNGHTYFREVLNQEGEPFHSIAKLNEGWKITPNEQGGIEIQDPDGTVRSYSGSLEEISQAPPRPSARPGQPPSTTPPTTTPPESNPPVDRPPTDGNGYFSNPQQNSEIISQIRSVYSENHYGDTFNPQVHDVIAVKFSTAGCGPCEQMDTTLTGWNDKPNGLFIANVDGSQNPQLARLYGIRRFPTTLFLRSDGSVIGQVTGALSRKQMANYYNKK